MCVSINFIVIIFKILVKALIFFVCVFSKDSGEPGVSGKLSTNGVSSSGGGSPSLYLKASK